MDDRENEKLFESLGFAWGRKRHKYEPQNRLQRERHYEDLNDNGLYANTLGDNNRPARRKDV